MLLYLVYRTSFTNLAAFLALGTRIIFVAWESFRFPKLFGKTLLKIVFSAPAHSAKTSIAANYVVFNHRVLLPFYLKIWLLPKYPHTF